MTHEEFTNISGQKVSFSVYTKTFEPMYMATDMDKRTFINFMMPTIKAVAKAIMKFDRFRMSLEGDYFVLHDQINIGVAVGLDEGLLVPVIRDVDKKSVDQISHEAKELARKAKTVGLTEEEVAERDVLRREYVNAVLGNVRSQLDNTYVVDQDGNKRKLSEKGGEQG